MIHQVVQLQENKVTQVVTETESREDNASKLPEVERTNAFWNKVPQTLTSMSQSPNIRSKHFSHGYPPPHRMWICAEGLENDTRVLSRSISNTSTMEEALIYRLFSGTHWEMDIKCCWKIINLKDTN